MIRLGLRLTLRGGQEAAVRLVLLTAAVAVGAALLLTTLAGLHAVQAQNDRFAWLETDYVSTNRPAPAGASDAMWWRGRADYYQGRQIARVDLAPLGARAPVPPGLPVLPGPGEYYASPALSALLHGVPAAQLGARFPGRQIGTIGPAALPSPHSLVVVIGRSVADLATDPDARRIDTIRTMTLNTCAGVCALGLSTGNDGMTLILTVVVAALVFPLLIFIGGATRLSAARREQRFAAMRLIGATPRQISVISTVESGVGAVVGVALGFVLYYLLRPATATIAFTGERFYVSDLQLGVRDVMLVAIGIPVGAAVAAWVALRRVSVSPLGVSRRATPRPPGAWRLLPLLAGLGELAYFAYVKDIGVDSHVGSGVESLAFLAGILTTMTGLVLAGAWLTMLGSRLMAHASTRPAALLATRRLADDPKAGFRAVSGLVLAVFVATCALGLIDSLVEQDRGGGSATALAKSTLVTQVRSDGGGRIATASGIVDGLSASPGVRGVAIVYTAPDPALEVRGRAAEPPPYYVRCAELAVVPALGRCPAGATVASIEPDYGGAVVDQSSMSDSTWSPAAVNPAQLPGLPVSAVVVATDGSSAAIEATRTVLGQSFPSAYASQTLHEYRRTTTQTLDSYQQLADVVLLASLPIAGCSLAVSVAAGLAERRRPFSLLRLTGAPVSLLRRTVALETLVPLLASAVISAGTALLAAHLFLRAQMYESLTPPTPRYYLLLIGGLIVALAVVASTLPLLSRATGPEAARND